ncbi:MAG: single-stranded DNA-binding protein [bacterium]|nr:single-stranded DNA-binding protein [bacterium]
MASFNKVILMGNLTRDPELRFTQSNMAVCKVGLAVNRRFKDGQTGEWREEPTFVDITIFGKRGEAFEKYHRKGASAFVEGSLRFDTWDDKNTGQKRSKLYVVADNWEFVGGGRESGAGGGGGGGYSSQQSAGAGAGGGGGGGGDGYGDAGGGGGAGAGAGDQGGGPPADGGNWGGGQDFIEADDTPF